MTIVEEPALLEEDEEEILEREPERVKKSSGSERGNALPAEDGETGWRRPAAAAAAAAKAVRRQTPAGCSTADGHG